MAVCLDKLHPSIARFFKPTPLMLPAPPAMLMLPEHAESLRKVDLTKKPKPPRKPKAVAPAPKKWGGFIKLYWTQLGDKDDILVEVHNPEIYAMLEILHGTQELELVERLNEDPRFSPFYELVGNKVDTYVERIMRIKRLHTDKWSWDWA